MNRIRTSLLRSNKGQSMAEFVVVVPVLIIMFWTVIYFGKAVLYKQRVATAARYAAFKEARGFGVGDIAGKFFYDIGPQHADRSGTTDFWPAVIGLEFEIPFFMHDQWLQGLMIPVVNWNVYSFANRERVSYSYDPPPSIGFVGAHNVSAQLQVDGNPWEWPWYSVLAWGVFYMINPPSSRPMWTPWPIFWD